jgi:hypothetical protein
MFQTKAPNKSFGPFDYAPHFARNDEASQGEQGRLCSGQVWGPNTLEMSGDVSHP